MVVDTSLNHTTGIGWATYLATPNPDIPETQVNVRSVVTTTGSESGLLGSGIPQQKAPGVFRSLKSPLPYVFRVD